MFNGLIIRRQSKNFCKNMLIESPLVKKGKAVLHFPSLSLYFSLIQALEEKGNRLTDDQSAGRANGGKDLKNFSRRLILGKGF